MKKFYQFTSNENSTELLIYGDITSWKQSDSDVGAYDFSQELAEVTTDLVVRINSYGGEVAEGLAIYNMLKSFSHKVTTVCDGFACSAASVIFMAGDVRIMRTASLLMIHNAWTIVIADHNGMRKTADDLEKITQPSVEVYKSVSNLEETTIKEMMDREEWISPKEALEYGFATAIEEQGAQQSVQDIAMYKLVMENKELKKSIEQNAQKQKEDVWASFLG